MISRSSTRPFGEHQRGSLPGYDERKKPKADDDEDCDPKVTSSRPWQLDHCFH